MEENKATISTLFTAISLLFFTTFGISIVTSFTMMMWWNTLMPVEFVRPTLSQWIAIYCILHIAKLPRDTEIISMIKMNTRDLIKLGAEETSLCYGDSTKANAKSIINESFYVFTQKCKASIYFLCFIFIYKYFIMK